jgi:arsenate reductase (thioredoxin)
MRTLFVCTGNTCRSPLAERLARRLYPEHQWESAGVLPSGLMHPMSAKVLRERGADATHFRGRYVGSLDLGQFDHVVLIGESARDLTPPAPEHVRVHFWKIPDPFNAIGSPDYVLSVYRTCADSIEEYLRRLMTNADAPAGTSPELTGPVVE